MAAPVIYLDQLRKTYLAPERDAGVMAAARSLVRRRQRAIKAVDGVSFALEEGEIVGFLGPNWRGQDDHPQDAGRPSASNVGGGMCAPL